MSTRRSDGGGARGGRAEVVDEFACSGMLRNSLTSLHSAVERIFCVIFDIGEDNFSSANTGQIWLKLRGPRNCVQAAKVSPCYLFIFLYFIWVDDFELVEPEWRKEKKTLQTEHYFTLSVSKVLEVLFVQSVATSLHPFSTLNNKQFVCFLLVCL